MKNSPQLNVLVSGDGVERVEVMYRPSERTAAWRLCERLLPLIEGLDNHVSGASGNSSRGTDASTK